jgi:hypothetical protein
LNSGSGLGGRNRRALQAGRAGEACRSARLRRFAASWQTKHGNGALLGPSGVGKTTASIALVKRFLAAGVEADYLGLHLMRTGRPPDCPAVACQP